MSDDRSKNERKDEMTRRAVLSVATAVASFGAAIGMHSSAAIAEDEHKRRRRPEHEHRREHEHRHWFEREHRRRHEHEH